MRLVTISFSALTVTATAALSGGGTVTSTEPGPASLAVETTEQMLDTMGITPATAKTSEAAPEPAIVLAKVEYNAPPAAPEAAETNAAKIEYAAPPPAPEAEQVEEVKVAEAPAGPPDPRETIRQCSTCHGVDGIAKIPTAPNIAGSSRQYLETQLKAFRSGKRENEVMGVIAEDLSNAEIKAAAKWYASLKVTVEVPE